MYPDSRVNFSLIPVVSLNAVAVTIRSPRALMMSSSMEPLIGAVMKTSLPDISSSRSAVTLIALSIMKDRPTSRMTVSEVMLDGRTKSMSSAPAWDRPKSKYSPARYSVQPEAWINW